MFWFCTSNTKYKERNETMFFESIRVTSKHNNTIIYFDRNGE